MVFNIGYLFEQLGNYFQITRPYLVTITLKYLESRTLTSVYYYKSSPQVIQEVVAWKEAPGALGIY